MTHIEHLFALTSILLAAAGFSLVIMAIRAYAQTSRRSMIHLSVGFTLIVAAAVATMISAFLNNFSGVRSLLLVNNGLTVTGYLFVMYSLITYQ